MGMGFSMAVRAKERPDQDHAGAGSSNEICEHRAEAQQEGVGERRAFEPSRDPDPARDDIKRRKKDDERNIITKRFSEKPRGVLSIDQKDRNNEYQSYQGLVFQAVPEAVGEQRQ